MTNLELASAINKAGPNIQNAIAAFLNASKHDQKTVEMFLDAKTTEKAKRQIVAILVGGDPFISKPQAAAILGLGVATIHRYIKQGKLKTINGRLTASIVHSFNKGADSETR